MARAQLLISTAFLVELIVMLAVAPKRWGYVRHHPLDPVIVVFTPPFLTSVLNGVRLLRLKPLVAWLFPSGGL